ncbi:glycosyltransferase family 2 protein [Hanstruepera marina]|uniref:glycosyltransferase family 2 protein n=1 Tax=Hanstruepera marina TaxID=2873265 RepID=UPI001CA60AD2|nr:glycosyltransferase family 2 protein [Hanstruepera marina]
MKENPLISVITVVYNGEQHIQQTIDSIRNQTYKNIEYIIVDGCSTDGTVNIIKDNNDVVTKWVSEPDKGLYDAMNKGAEMANGILIGTINSDDWYENNAVELIVEAFKNNPSKLIFHADKNCIEPKGGIHVKKGRTSTFFLKYYAMIMNHPTMFVHKELYKDHKYNIELTSLSDYQFVLEVLNDKGNVFYYVPKVISNFRLGGISGRLQFKKVLIENYKARHLSGMNHFQCLFGMFFRLNAEVYKYLFT